MMACNESTWRMRTDLRRLIDRLDPAARAALEGAVGLAVTNTNGSVEVVHWLIRLVAPASAPGLDRLLDLAVLDAELTRALGRQRRGHSGAPAIAPGVVAWMQEGWLAASLGADRRVVTAFDLLAALLDEPTLAAVARDVAPELARQDPQVLQALAPDTSPAGAVPAPPPASGGALDQYTTDLVAAAKAGRIDPIIGRDDEIRQVIDVLTRRRQNNPILVGEAGVGKTAIVEGLALRIATGDVPPALRGTQLRTLDLGLLQAGAGVKGEFENRLKGVVQAVKDSPVPVILFIDEAHTLVGAGGNGAGGGDAANLIKPELARGELRTVAATTWAEYKKYFEKDAALTRRFQPVKVDEPAEPVAVSMLRALLPSLEKHHGVRILDEALHEAVRLSARFIPARQLPDKCVSLIDTAAASVAIGRSTTPAAIEDALREIDRLDVEAALLRRDEVTEGLPAIAARRIALEERRDTLQTRWEQERDLVSQADAAAGEARTALLAELRAIQGEHPLVRFHVDGAAVAEVVTRWTGIPVGRMQRGDVNNLLGLEAALRRRVLGQDHALRAVTSAMEVSGAHLADPRKPVAVFMLVGPSGVGKTETALALADQLYGGPQSLTTINLSEFKEEHKVSMLVGAPAGYVGYGEGGVLTEAVRRRPHGVLLLDEVEKAHPGVQDVFYQVFDKGSLRDGEGRDIDFRHTTILLTSNVGTDLLTALAADLDTVPDPAALEELLRPALLKVFKPAFLGRITVIPYLPLSDAVLLGVVRLQLGRLERRVREAHGAVLDVGEGVEHFIAARARDSAIGARAVEQLIARQVLPDLSRLFLHALADGQVPDRIALDAGVDGLHLTASPKPDAAPAVPVPDPVAAIAGN